MLCFRVVRRFCTKPAASLEINQQNFKTDNFTNVRPHILKLLDRRLYLKNEHPLSFIRQSIVNYFDESFRDNTGKPLFSVFNDLNQVVSTYQNFDSLLVPENHVSRSISDCYYINKDLLLRSHMTAHQSELMKMGENRFLMVGDVYRRDEIDSRHYPVFHQLDGVKLFGADEMNLTIMRDQTQGRSEDCQEVYTLEATNKVAEDLKRTLEKLCEKLFGKEIIYKWTNSYFPFTHPSWELEIQIDSNWCEILGCGVIEYNILKEAGIENKIGWAFGMGLERLAMIFYDIPDIRIFWLQDTGFLSQFHGKSFSDKIKYKPISVFPQCKNHISFWIPESYSSNDFYELVREVGGPLVEQVHLIDEFKKKDKTSHCYEIVYRHPNKTFTKDEVNDIHNAISTKAAELLKVKLR